MKESFRGFRIIEQIAQGGMATIYKAHQESLDRIVCVKELFPHMAADEALIARFEREAKAAASLNHENIVGVIDFGREDDFYYIVMEYIEGVDLASVLKQVEIPYEIALILFHEILRGLDFAHQMGLIHRDIKPSNVLFSKKGEVKLADFGLARQGEKMTSLTMTGTVMGTPSYMSPEQAMGKMVDGRSDIFSLGVVAYELFGGRKPFGGDSYAAVIHSIMNVEPDPIQTINPVVPDELARIIEKCLHKDPSKRYQDTGSVLRDLESIVEELGILRLKRHLAPFAQDPEGYREILRKKEVAKYLDLGSYYMNLGLGKIDDAIREFKRVLFLDPDNESADKNYKKLLSQKRKLKAHQADLERQKDEGTILVEPGAVPKTSTTAKRAIVERKRPKANLPRLVVGGVLIVVLAAIGILVVPRLFSGDSTSASNQQTRATRNPSGQEGTGGVTEGVTDGDASSRSAATGEEAEADAADPEPSPVVVSADEYYLRVSTNPPGATVYVDGKKWREATPALIGPVDKGGHRLKFTKSGYETQEQRVSADKKGTTSVSYNLESVPIAIVAVSVKPYATYYVDGEKVGKDNVPYAKIEVPAGRHTIRAVHPVLGEKVWEDVEFRPGDNERLSHQFSLSGELTVRSQPWGYVYIDGRNTGKTTPASFPDLRVGVHKIVVKRDGFTCKEGEQEIRIEGGKETAITFTLEQD